MKSTRIILALLLIVLVLQGLGLTAVAQGPAGTWASGIQIQNQSETETANITINFYWSENSGNASATPAATFTDTIEPGKSKTYYVPSHIPQVPDDFEGSAVVTSDQPIAAILNTTRVDGTDKRLGSATGVLSPAMMVYAPYLRKNYYDRNSYIAVQNTSDSAASITITYYKADGTQTATEQATISAYSTEIFHQNENANLDDGFHGSATIEGDAPLAVVVNNANAGTSTTSSGFESYNGMATGATTLYAPKLTVRYYDYQSSFTVQNMGTADATVTVNYDYGGTPYTHTSGPIAPGASWPVYLAAEAQSNLPATLSGSGSAVITSDQPLVGIVTEVNEALGYAVIWNAIPGGSGTDTILFPKFDRTYYDYNGGIQIQNIGTQDTTLTAVFSQSGRADVTVVSGPVAPGASTFWYAPNVQDLTENFSGSVVVVSSNGQPIAGVYTSRNDILTGDSYSAYNGIQK